MASLRSAILPRMKLAIMVFSAWKCALEREIIETLPHKLPCFEAMHKCCQVSNAVCSHSGTVVCRGGPQKLARVLPTSDWKSARTEKASS